MYLFVFLIRKCDKASRGTKGPEYGCRSAHAPKPHLHAACWVWIPAPPIATRITLLAGHFSPRQRELSLISPPFPLFSQSRPAAGKAVAQGNLRGFLSRVSTFCISFANTEAELEGGGYLGWPHWSTWEDLGRNLWNSWHWQRNICLGWLLVWGAAVNQQQLAGTVNASNSGPDSQCHHVKIWSFSNSFSCFALLFLFNINIVFPQKLSQLKLWAKLSERLH